MYKFQSLKSPKRIFFPLPPSFMSPWDLLHRPLTNQALSCYPYDSARFPKPRPLPHCPKCAKYQP